MKESHVGDCRMLELPKVHNHAGNITPIESSREVPFSIERVYYLYDIPGGETRGGHAHRLLQQLIVAATGSFDVVVDDGLTRQRFHLSRSYQGLYMPAGIWRELENFSSAGICLVLASRKYSESDYIRSYQQFVAYKQQ